MKSFESAKYPNGPLEEPEKFHRAHVIGMNESVKREDLALSYYCASACYERGGSLVYKLNENGTNTATVGPLYNQHSNLIKPGTFCDSHYIDARAGIKASDRNHLIINPCKKDTFLRYNSSNCSINS